MKETNEPEGEGLQGYSPVPQYDNQENQQQNFDGIQSPEDEINDNKEIDLSEKVRWIVYAFFLTANTLISMDHGSIPASTGELRKQLTSFDQGIGLFGSLVYFGNIIGSMIFFKLINIYNRKFLLIISLLANAICLFVFVFTTNLILLFLNRVIVGLFQAYITIYMPVWCNQFGKKENRTMMIACIQLVSPIGVFLGYLVASICIKEKALGGWAFAFILQSLLIVLLSVLFLFIPLNYFDKKIYSFNSPQGNEYFRQVHTLEKIKETEEMPLLKMIKLILEQKVFIFSVLGLSVLIYVITGVQYWISDYMMSILAIRSPKTRLFYFTLVCFTSPTLGVLLGTITKNKFCQNDTNKSLGFCFILAILASGCAIPVPLVSYIPVFLLLMWLVLFFGGGIVPVITNIIVVSLPRRLDASGNSITNFVSNLAGYLPAPYVYGILSDIFWDKGLLGMKVTMWYSIIGVIFFGLATIAGYKEWDVRSEESQNVNLNYDLKN